ncbi:MAG: lipocalin family protein, partial [Pseudomonadales bacterium]|nr:lipocalin family protein [Pseudomonadales bacterium]
YRACYEGTMNTSYLSFRKDGTFDDYNIGFFAYARYINGTWTQKGDTLELKYSEEKLDILGDKLVFINGKIFSIKADSLIDTRYYLGFCNGLN